MKNAPLEAAVSELVAHKAEEAFTHLRTALFSRLGIKAPRRVPVSAPPPAVEKAEAKPRRARAPRAEVSKPAKVGTAPRKREADRESVPPSALPLSRPPVGAANGAKRSPSAAVPAALGTFKLEGPTPERWHGQVVYAYRCTECATEKKLPSQNARRLKNPPKCKCETTEPAPVRSPKAARPTPAPKAPAPAVVAKARAHAPEPPVERMAAPKPEKWKAPELVGEMVATFRGIAKTAERRMGNVVVLFRCTECGAERMWTRLNVAQVRKKRGFACECQGGAKPQTTGRVPVRMLSEPSEEKPVEDLEGDELEAAVLAEFERDKALPSMRSDDAPRREAGSLLDEPDDDEEDDEDAEPRDRASGDDDDD